MRHSLPWLNKASQRIGTSLSDFMTDMRKLAQVFSLACSRLPDPLILVSQKGLDNWKIGRYQIQVHTRTIAILFKESGCTFSPEATSVKRMPLFPSILFLINIAIFRLARPYTLGKVSTKPREYLPYVLTLGECPGPGSKS